MRNGAGTFSLVAGNPVVTGTSISSTWANNTLSDIATALTQSIAVDGQSPVTANIPFNSHKLTGVAAGSTANDALVYGQTNASLAGLTLTAALNTAQGADIASAGTIDLDAATGNVVDVTGTTTITAITLSQGRVRIVRFTGILTLTNGASLVLPGAANITTAAGDYMIVAGYAAGVVRVVMYTRASGLSVIVIRSYLAGCAISNGTDAVNDINIAAGQCTDSTNAVLIAVAAMAGKQLDAGWAVGANAGMRNSAIAIANTTYHIYAVAKADGTQDIYAHTSTVVATVITALQAEVGGSAYVYARRIFSIIRAGATILPFIVNGDKVTYTTAIQDISSGANPGAAAVTRTLGSIPLGINVQADIQFTVINTGAAGNAYGLLTDLATVDVAPTQTRCDTGGVATAAGGDASQTALKLVGTNTSAQIRARLAFSDASVSYVIVTLGYVDNLGRNS